MFNLALARQLGSPFCIYVPVTATRNLLVPNAQVLVRDAITSTIKYQMGDRIVILGFAYDFVAASGNGFDIVQRHYGTGSEVDKTIFGARASANDLRVALSVPETFIPLDAGTASPQNPATLRLVTTAGAPASGQLLIWGAISANEAMTANRYIGSPS